jgi:hypothetical protein
MRNVQKTADSEFQEFERLCLECLRFLEDDFGFRVLKIEREPYGTFITYQNSSTAVRASLELREGGIFVLLSRLVDGQIPEYPVFVQANTPLHSFYLDDLVQAKGGELRTNRNIEGSLTKAAEALRVFASDVLKGDFAVFDKLDRVVKERARRLAE